jgi:two-component system, chemotaxis family, sensor kinase CheA
MSPASAEQRERIRQLFAHEAATRLDGLAGRLLELERVGDDPELVAEIFREAHNLKGSAAVVGFKNVTEVAHTVEDLLEELRSRRRSATPELVDGVLVAVDGLRAMIPRVMAGEDCTPEAAELIRGILALTATTPAPPPRTPTPPAPAKAPTTKAPAPPAKPASPPPTGAGAVSSTPAPPAPPPVEKEPPAPAAEPAAPVADAATTTAPTPPAESQAPAAPAVEPAPTAHASTAAAPSQPAARPEVVAPSAPAAPTAPAVPAPGPPARVAVVTPAPAADAQAGGRAVGGEVVRVPVGRLDRLVRQIGETAAAHLRLSRRLVDRLGPAVAGVDELHELARTLNELQAIAMRARMVPVATITSALHRAVRDLARSLGKKVRWEAAGTDTELDRNVLEQLADPLLHLVRNAVDHGIESPEERERAGKPAEGFVRLQAWQAGSEVVVTVSDDGRGIDGERVRSAASARGVDLDEGHDALEAIFDSGLSTAETISDVSGRGVGLDVVRANVQAIRGRVEVASTPGAGAEFRVVVPITLAVLRCLLVEAGGRRYALPMHSVMMAARPDPDEGLRAGGRAAMWVDDDVVQISGLAASLGTEDETPGDGPVVVVAGLAGRHAFRVDRLLGQRELVVKGLGPLLPRVDVLAGGSVEPDGSVVPVLDVAGLVERAHRTRAAAPAPVPAEAAALPERERPSILIVDDALPVRELERAILERAGFEVRTAGDGDEALALLAERPADLVLSDVEMPHMNGLELTRAIRAEPHIRNVAVLLLTSRSSEQDRRAGLEAGADGYLVKSAFDEATLLAAVERLLGQAGPGAGEPVPRPRP